MNKSHKGSFHTNPNEKVLRVRKANG
jgi:hypothetical protein